MSKQYHEKKSKQYQNQMAFFSVILIIILLLIGATNFCAGQAAQIIHEPIVLNMSPEAIRMDYYPELDADSQVESVSAQVTVMDSYNRTLAVTAARAAFGRAVIIEDGPRKLTLWLPWPRKVAQQWLDGHPLTLVINLNITGPVLEGYPTGWEHRFSIRPDGM